MPCNCVVDKPTYPQNEEWGPIFWSVAHSFAERAGKQTNTMTQSDEMRAWPLFVKTFVPCIPCPYCREHAAEWVKANPFTLPERYEEWSFFIRMWWWRFHEDVNSRLGKPSFPLNQLADKYRDVSSFKFWFRQIEAYELRAAKMDGIRLFEWFAWKKEFVILRGTFGI